MLQSLKSFTATALLVVACSIPLLACDRELPPLEVQTQVFLSKTYVVDQVY